MNIFIFALLSCIVTLTWQTPLVTIKSVSIIGTLHQVDLQSNDTRKISAGKHTASENINDTAGVDPDLTQPIQVDTLQPSQGSCSCGIRNPNGVRCERRNLMQLVNCPRVTSRPLPRPLES